MIRSEARTHKRNAPSYHPSIMEQTQALLAKVNMTPENKASARLYRNMKGQFNRDEMRESKANSFITKSSESSNSRFMDSRSVKRNEILYDSGKKIPGDSGSLKHRLPSISPTSKLPSCFMQKVDPESVYKKYSRCFQITKHHNSYEDTAPKYLKNKSHFQHKAK